MDLQSTYIAVHNYIPNPDIKSLHDITLLPLWIGERLKVIAENGSWCFGHYECDSLQQGLFPKTHIQELAIPTNNNSETQQLIDEITEAVKIWWRCVKDGYRSNKFSPQDYEKFVKFIKDLMIIRNKLQSGNVPMGELKEIRLTIANKIDVGNFCMGLNMHIRNELGKVIRAEELSVVSAYRQHELAYTKLASDCIQSNKVDKFSILININSVTEIKSFAYDAEFALNLINAKTGEVLTETLTLHWSKATRRFAHDSCRGLFVDLTAKEVRDVNFLLSIKMMKLAPIDPSPSTPSKKLSSHHRSDSNNLNSASLPQLRQPFARGDINLSETVRDIINKEKREILLNLVKTSTSNHLSTSANLASTTTSKPFPFFSNNKHGNNQNQLINDSYASTASSSFDYKIPLTITIQLIAGTLESIHSDNPDIFLSTNPPPPAILQKIHPTNMKSVLDFRRNEVYVYLKSADLRIGKSLTYSSSSSTNPTTDKNFEAILSLWDSEGNQFYQCFENIGPDRIVRADTFRTCVLVREERPCFDEIVKIVLPERAVKGLHLRVLFYNRKTNYGDKNGCGTEGNNVKKGMFDVPIALSFLHLVQSYALVPDYKTNANSGAKTLEDMEMLVYKIDPVKFDERNIFYLRLASKRQDLMPKNSNAGASGHNHTRSVETGYGAFTLAEKSSFSLRYHAVSAVHTKSVCLLHIFRWRQIGATSAMLNERIRDIIDASIGVPTSGIPQEDSAEFHTDELLKFLPAFLDALFQIAADERTTPESQLTVFDAVVYVIRLCDEPKNLQFQDILVEYVEKFYWTTAHVFLLKNLTQYIENEDQSRIPGSSRDCLLPVLKSLGLLTQLIVVSRNCCNSINLKLIGRDGGHNKELTNLQFTGKMDNLLHAIELLIRSGSTARMTCQNAALKFFPSMISPLIRYDIYEPLKLAQFIVTLINDLSDAIVVRQKLAFISEIIDTDLFASKECRKLLMPIFLDKLLSFMSPHLWYSSPVVSTLNQQLKECELKHQQSINARSSIPSTNAQVSSTDTIEVVELSAKIVTDLIEKLFPYSRSRSVVQCGTVDELQMILFKMFRPTNQIVIVLLGDPTHQRALHTLLLALLDKFSSENFLKYFNRLRTNIDRLDALSEMLHMFRDLLLRCPLPSEWYQIRHLQHKLFIKHLRFANALIVKQFGGMLSPTEDTNRSSVVSKYSGISIRRGGENICSSEKAVFPVYDWEGRFVPDIWLECMLTAVAMVKSLMAVIGNLDSSNCLHESSSFSAAYEQSNCDMRTIAATTLRSLWFSMGAAQKMLLWPHILSSVLEVALCEDNYLRKITIPIFYDMLETEHFWTNTSVANDHIYDCYDGTKSLSINSASISTRFSDQFRNSSISSGGGFSTVNTTQHCLFADEFIKQLDPLLDSNRGGPEFRTHFYEMFMERYASSPTMKSATQTSNYGIKFVEKVDKLLELLLNYRQVRLNSDCIENGMYCTVQLIDFYQKIGQNALYVNYLYKLYDLHVMSGNCVEAALTLKKHANLLKWNEDKVEDYLVAKPIHRHYKTQVKLKERIYIEMAELFDRGEHWEQAVEVLKDLIPVYENILFDYVELSSLLQRLAELYKKITSTIRMENNYFLVNFYGCQSPPYLMGQKFVFRGEKLEQWNSFKQRMLHNYYGFKFIDSVDNCYEQYANVPGKFIQIIPITAQPSATYTVLNKSAHRLTRWYYKHHKVQRFEQLRRETRTDTKWTKLDCNDVTKMWIKRKYISIDKPLPDILKFAPVVSEVEPDSANPVDVAALKIQEVNDQLTETAQLVAAGFVQFLVNLGGLVRGVVQADVGGGIRNYEPFFTEECWRDASEAERKSITLLKTLLREHVVILEYSLYVHASKHSQVNDAFHNSLVEIFIDYRNNIENRFGKIKSILPPGASIYLDNSSNLGAASSGSTPNLAVNSSGTDLHSALTTQSPLHHTSGNTINANCSLDQPDFSLQCQSTPENSTSVLFRHVPTTLLRNTRNRSKTNASLLGNTSSPNHTPALLKKQNLRQGRQVSGGPLYESHSKCDIYELSTEQQQKEQNLAMMSALRQVAASRFSSDSINVDDLIITTDDNSIKSETPSLPLRTSIIHSPEILRRN